MSTETTTQTDLHPVSLTQTERRSLGCFCVRNNGVWHHQRRCPVPTVETILTARSQPPLTEQALTDLLKAHEEWEEEVDEERTTDSFVVWMFRCECGEPLGRGMADDAHRRHVAAMLAAAIRGDDLPT